MPTYPAPTIQQAYTYVQDSEPAGPTVGETWLDTGSETPREAFAWDGATWVKLSATDHSELAGIGPADHHQPVSVTGPLTVTADQTLGLTATAGLGVTSDGALVALLDEGLGLDANGNIRVDLADGLTIDTDGNVRVAGGGVTQSMLGFNAATQAAVDSVTSDLDNHAGSTGGVHGVASGDSVASQSDVDSVTNSLNGHEADSSNPHNVTDDQTGAAAALSNHESDSTAHHARPSEASGFSPPDSAFRTYTAISGGVETGETIREQIHGYVREVTTDSPFYPGLSAVLLDGTTVELPNGGSKTINARVDYVEASVSSSSAGATYTTIEVEEYVPGPHSHTLQ